MARTSKVEANVLALCQQGLTTAEIADRAGVTDRTVRRIRAKHGLSQASPGSGKRLTAEDHAHAQEWIRDGWSLSEISTTLGFGRQAMYRHYKGQGWDQQTSGRYARLISTMGRI